MREERYPVSFSVCLMWQEKSGAVRRVNGRCVDLSPEGMKVEMRDRVEAGTSVLVSSREFGRMGHATVRHSTRDRMRCLVGVSFGSAFGLSDPARRKILGSVLREQSAAPEGDSLPPGPPA